MYIYRDLYRGVYELNSLKVFFMGSMGEHYRGY